MEADYIRKFIDEVILPQKNPLPGLNKSVRVNPDSGEEWDDWLVLDSTVSDEDLDKIEDRFNFRFPEELRGYLKYKIIIDGDFGLYRFSKMEPENPLGDIVSQIEIIDAWPIFKRLKLVPFAQDGNDGGPICFSYDADNSKDNYQVYFLDYELLNSDGYKGEFIYQSFRELFDAIEKDILSYER